MNEQALDVRVEGLARELARTINGGAAEGREQLRELAIELIREEVRVDRESTPEPAPISHGRGSFNTFVLAIPLFVMGALLAPLFPPVGVLLFAAAVFMMGWGVIATVLFRR